ncbi:hypothetical protein DPMN_193453 [Dreissena polymorpha]|uniref:Uncharacterized protein n=1 Tax=Dreissena polymorpha TaxID=45954 RepID=A0A9D3Y250_DREPO|nr:hypothetical protein DPMN_193453 [Dreissena polymorpha]
MLQEMNFWNSMNDRLRPALAQMHQMPEKNHSKMFASPELGNRDPIYISKQYSDKRPPASALMIAHSTLQQEPCPLLTFLISGSYDRNLVNKKLPRC